MAFTSSSQTDTIIGTLDGGRKVVSTVVTVLDSLTNQTQITINPITRVVSFIPSIINYGTMGATTASGTIVFSDGLSGANKISFTPGVGGSLNSVFEILSVGV